MNTWMVIKKGSTKSLSKVLFTGDKQSAYTAFNTEFLRMKRGRLQLIGPDGTVHLDTNNLKSKGAKMA